MAGGAANLSGGKEGGSPIGFGLVVAEGDVDAIAGSGNGQDVGAPADRWVVLAEPRLTQDEVIPRQIQGVEGGCECVVVLVGAKSDGNAFVEGQRGVARAVCQDDSGVGRSWRREIRQLACKLLAEEHAFGAAVHNKGRWCGAASAAEIYGMIVAGERSRVHQ